MVTEGAWCRLWKVFSNSGSRFFSSEVKNLFWIPYSNKPLQPGNNVQPEEGRAQVQNNCLPTVMSDVKHHLVR